MSKLPKVDEAIQVFGIGCEGCGHFRGEFKVLSVNEKGNVSMVLDPQDVQCEGMVEDGAFGHLRLLWNPDLECWESACGDHQIVVHVSGHYHGPLSQAA